MDAETIEKVFEAFNVTLTNIIFECGAAQFETV